MAGLGIFLQLAVKLGTPFLFGTLGGIMCEKAGHLNLGIEGMMMMGAFFGFIGGNSTGNFMMALILGAAGGALGALIYAVITITLKGNQTVTGFALTIFGVGFANFLGRPYAGTLMTDSVTSALGTHVIPLLSSIPIIGPAIFSQDIMVYMAIIIAILMMLYFVKTRFGLSLRMVGENPGAADASGINVDLYKYVHVLIGGALCGLGGAYISTVYVPYWQDNIISGIGWIAVALVIFSAWNPIKAIFGCYLFGILKALAIQFQNVSFGVGSVQITIASQVMDMMPYILTIIVLVISAASSRRKSGAPASVGQSYFREDR